MANLAADVPQLTTPAGVEASLAVQPAAADPSVPFDDMVY
ncbi:MAG: hypothetical protein K0S07_1445, partial [Chlamydiales bacterium]|nr:hypothetical protein [Chlamydiales bacterium]